MTAYPAPLLAEKMDQAALDEMLRMLDRYGRVLPTGGGNAPWYRRRDWAQVIGPRRVDERTPPETAHDDEREQVMSEHAIEIYYRQFADTGRR